MASHKEFIKNPLTRKPSFRTEFVIPSYEYSYKQIQSKKFIKYNFDRLIIILNLIKHRIFNVSNENDTLLFYNNCFEIAIQTYNDFNKTIIQSYLNPQDIHLIIDDLKKYIINSPDDILSIYYFLILMYINDYFIPLYNKVFIYMKPKYSIVRIIDTLTTILNNIKSNLELQHSNPLIGILFSSLLISLSQYEIFGSNYKFCQNRINELNKLYINLHKNIMFEYTLKIDDFEKNKNFCKLNNCKDKIIQFINDIEKNLNLFYYKIYRNIDYKNEMLIITQLINIYKLMIKQSDALPELNIPKININEHLKEFAETEETIIKEYEESQKQLQLQLYEQQRQNKETMTNIILYNKVPKMPTLTVNSSGSATSSSSSLSRSSSDEFSDFNRLSPTNLGDTFSDIQLSHFSTEIKEKR